MWGGSFVTFPSFHFLKEKKKTVVRRFVSLSFFFKKKTLVGQRFFSDHHQKEFKSVDQTNIFFTTPIESARLYIHTHTHTYTHSHQ